jgi:uncharacterized protein YggE
MQPSVSRSTERGATPAGRGAHPDVQPPGHAELRAAARREAVAAARRRADLHAEAAGVRLGAVLLVEDVDPEANGRERYRGHATTDGASEQDLAPGQVVVSAMVTLGFGILPG